VLLTEPAEGVPPVVSDPATLRRAAATLADGAGPVAVDTERASGYRYSQRAYLVQLVDACQGNVSEAARRSGLSRVRLYEMLSRWKLKSR